MENDERGYWRVNVNKENKFYEWLMAEKFTRAWYLKLYICRKWSNQRFRKTTSITRNRYARRRKKLRKARKAWRERIFLIVCLDFGIMPLLGNRAGCFLRCDCRAKPFAPDWENSWHSTDSQSGLTRQRVHIVFGVGSRWNSDIFKRNGVVGNQRSF